MMRDDILRRMSLVMGELPPDSKLVSTDWWGERELELEGVTCRNISFATEAGDRCRAWVQVPAACLAEGAKPQAAIVCLHQTTAIGKDEPAGMGGLPNLHYALELAKRGFVTISPDYPNYGEYKVDPYAMGYISATMKGIWNHMRAVDVLEELPFVDPNRIGCIGHSLGGHNTLFLAAFDERIKVAVSSCGFTLFRCNRRGGDGAGDDVSDWSHNGYMPLIKTRYNSKGSNMPFEWTDVLDAIAPRAVFINAPEHDMFLPDGVRECVAHAAPRYKGFADKLVCVHPPCEHDFPPATREQAHAFLEKNLKG